MSKIGRYIVFLPKKRAYVDISTDNVKEQVIEVLELHGMEEAKELLMESIEVMNLTEHGIYVIPVKDEKYLVLDYDNPEDSYVTERDVTIGIPFGKEYSEPDREVVEL